MVTGLVCPSLSWRVLAAGDALAHESNQLVLGFELLLLAGVYFLHQPVQPIGIAPAHVPKLNYKCAPHDYFRICILASQFVEISWRLCRFCMAPAGSNPVSGGANRVESPLGPRVKFRGLKRRKMTGM